MGHVRKDLAREIDTVWATTWARLLVLVRFYMLSYMEKTRYVICWWYGMMVRCGGCNILLNIVWWYGMF